MISIEAKADQGQTISADFSHRSLRSVLAVLSQQLKGNLMCRISSLKSDTGNAELQIAIQIRSKPGK